MTPLAISLDTIIKNRRSVYPAMYNDTPISRETIEQIVSSANYAPTHKKTQPWRFAIITKDAIPRFATTLADIYKTNIAPEKYSENRYADLQAKANKAGAIIAIVLQAHPDLLPEWEELAATACAVQNMWLTATALGVGAYWSSPSMINGLNSYLGLTDNQKCIGLFYMGYTDIEVPASPRTPISEKTSWIEK